jgi:hypothetical protein
MSNLCASRRYVRNYRLGQWSRSLRRTAQYVRWPVARLRQADGARFGDLAFAKTYNLQREELLHGYSAVA